MIQLCRFRQVARQVVRHAVGFLLGLLCLVFLILAIATALHLADRQVANVPLGPQQVVHTVNPKLACTPG